MSSLIFPTSLQQGDQVLIISPAGKIDRRLLGGLKNRLQEWGLKPIVAKHARAKSESFAGTIKQRLADLQYGLDNTKIKAIFCSRGGYGTIQLTEQLDLTGFKNHPKWIIGYSDITVLHSLLQAKGYASIHAPMARHFTLAPKEDLALALLKKTLMREPIHYTFKAHKYNHKESSKGILRGGNLTVLQGLKGTAYDFNPTNTILYLEDVNESPNTIQRMFYNLKLSGVLEQLSGLILGQFTDTLENKNISDEVYKKIQPLLKSYTYPICYNFPIGHLSQNYPLINGAEAHLITNKHTSELKFG